MSTAVPLQEDSQVASRAGALSLMILPERILVVRLSAMGDILHAMPAVAALHRFKPELKIGWLVEQRWVELLCSGEAGRLDTRRDDKPLADWVHTTNFSAWRRAMLSGDSWRAMRSCLSEVRKMHYDIALDLQGTLRSALAAQLSGAKVSIGSAQPREVPAQMLYTKSVSPQGEHVIAQALWLASSLAGEPLTYIEPPLPHNPGAESWAAELHSNLGARPLAIVNPGAGWGAKCWPAESFGKVARALSERGMAVLTNYGPGEQGLAESVRVASGDSAHPLTCSVSELIAITRRASLFIGGDTGPMHLAAVLRVPVVALFGPTRPERTGPFATRSVVLRSPHSVFNSSHASRPDEGLLSIDAQTVIDAADRLLGGESG